MEKLDFVTVVYRDELNILRAQARSFAVHVPTDIVRNIYLVINDASLTKSDLATVMTIYGPHAENVKVFTSSFVAPQMSENTHGWWAQQILKLRIAGHATADFLVILDSKNHFIRPISSDHFVTDRRIKTWLHSYIDNAENHCRGSFAYFGLDVTPYINALPPSITPITLRRNVVIDLLEHVETRSKKTFESDFLNHPNVTEFIMYYAFLIYKGLSLENEYFIGEPQVATLFLDKVRDENRFNSVMYQASQSSRVAFGIHRSAVAQLTTPQTIRIFEFWKSTGLFVTEEESLRWLTPGDAEDKDFFR